MDFNSDSTSAAVMMTKDRRLNSPDSVNSNKVRVRVPVPAKVFSSNSSAVDQCRFSTPHVCDHTQLLLQNYKNFKMSDEPSRFMYYESGSWLDFAKEVLEELKSGFLEGKPVVDTSVGERHRLFDFYRMLEIDLETENQRSIAWIDIEGKCFFPKVFVNTSGDVADLHVSKLEVENAVEESNSEKLNIEIEVRLCGNTITNSNNFDQSKSNLSKRKREVEQSQVDVLANGKTDEGSSSNYNGKRRHVISCELQSPRWQKTRLLRPEEKGHSIVKKLFLSGLGLLEPGATITAIHQWAKTGPLDKARCEVFQTQLDITRKARGDPNMVFAWHGTSAEGVDSILTHGFGMTNKPSDPEAHGVGIYLSPIKCPQNSASMSPVDENGEKHVILCRVILGKCEKVNPGSQQLHPSSVDFDTGVDDLMDPRWYVVWFANSNTHILPECIVSYRPAKNVTGQLKGSVTGNSVPNAANSLVAKLFAKLGTSLTPSKVRELQILCRLYKDGTMKKDSFMKQLRSVVGDEILRSTIHEIRGQ